MMPDWSEQNARPVPFFAGTAEDLYSLWGFVLTLHSSWKMQPLCSLPLVINLSSLLACIAVGAALSGSGLSD